MGYAVYEDETARELGVTRWAGYGVPGVCDDPECDTEIGRGMGYRCERRYIEDADVQEREVEGCGLHFCEEHLSTGCSEEHATYTPTPDTPEWERHMLTDDSWEQWRTDNPGLVALMQAHQHSKEKGTMIDIERIAHVCHEANRALQLTGGEESVSPHFLDAPEWQVQSTYEGVTAALEGQTPEQLHESWMRSKIRDGWRWGEVKDANALTHPCIVPYAELPAGQRIKDAVFHGIVAAFSATNQEDGGVAR